MVRHTATSNRRHRLEIRVSAEQDALIRQAADLEDTTVTALFVEHPKLPGT